MTITAAILESTLAKLGYKYFTEGDYNLNIIGIRNSSTGAKVTNAFDDYIAVAFKVTSVGMTSISSVRVNWRCCITRIEAESPPHPRRSYATRTTILGA